MSQQPTPSPPPRQSHQIHIPTVGGTRSFLLHIPQAYIPNTPAPLILAFHGKGQTAHQFESQTSLSYPHFNSTYIVAYPQGLSNQWTGDPESTPTSEINDIDFAGALLAHLVATYSVDETRIYAVGFSNGGGLTALLAGNDQMSSRIAAFAIVSGAMYRDEALKTGEKLFSTCEPSRLPVPILEFHGSKDPVIHYEGVTTPDGPTYSIQEWLQAWAERNGCGEPAEKTELEGGSLLKTRWSRGEQELVVHYYIEGFGHGWPSKRAQDDDGQRFGPATFDATPMILEFFGGHRLPVSYVVK
jgi:poly(3-hydroxybutyrate) depolymerase